MDKLEDQLNNIMTWLGKIEAELKRKSDGGHGHMRDPMLGILK